MGGFRTLAASAKVPCQTGKSGHPSPGREKPTCCAAHQGQQSAGSALCKFGGLTQSAEVLCCVAARRSCRSLRLRVVGPSEFTHSGTFLPFSARAAWERPSGLCTQGADFAKPLATNAKRIDFREKHKSWSWILPRHILITGPAENQSQQKHPIYNDLNGYPTGLTWQVDIGPLRVSTEEFFENLFFSVEKNGGNGFFYPKDDEDRTICRYEWHLPWRNRAAQIRLGIVFHVRRGETPHHGLAYFGTNEGYRKRGAPNNPSRISKKKFYGFKEFIKGEVLLANKARPERPQGDWKFIFFAKSGGKFWEKPFLALNRKVLVLPPVSEDGLIKNAVVINASGITQGHAHRKAMKTYQRILALLTLTTGTVWEASSHPDNYNLLEGNLSVRSDLSNKLFPNGKPVQGLGSPVPRLLLAVVRYGLTALDDEQDFTRTYLSSLFAFYGGMVARAKTPSLANVGLIAALGLLASPKQERCGGKLTCSSCGHLDFRHNLVGDRAAISEMLSDVMSEVFGEEFERTQSFEKWVKEIYNTHRSNYVHSAAHQFSEFSQVFSSKGPSTTLVPTAVPSNGKLTRKENGHRAITSKLPLIAQIVLIRFLMKTASSSRVVNRLQISIPDFSSAMEEEAFCGLPTLGWVRMT